MKTASSFSQEFQRAVMHPTGAIVGLVDGVLTLCREHGLELDWNLDRCLLRPAGGIADETVSVLLRKSVFRAVLARFAILCRERVPESVSMYGGTGELLFGTHPPAVFKVSFSNTPDAQWLRLRPGRSVNGVAS
jgi:hypothetical protein